MHSEQVSKGIIQFYGKKELDEHERELIQRARNATGNSYSPYSHFCVGCAVRLWSGEIVEGTNCENASYGLACCAERTTLFAINNMGKRDEVKAVAITGRPAAVEPYYKGKEPLAPCGACRQVLKEFEDLARQPFVILMDCFDDERIARLVGIESLLPLAFGPADFVSTA